MAKSNGKLQANSRRVPKNGSAKDAIALLKAAFTLMGPEFMRAEPSWQPRPAQ